MGQCRRSRAVGLSMSDVLAKYGIRTIGMGWYSPEAWRELQAIPEAGVKLT